MLPYPIDPLYQQIFQNTLYPQQPRTTAKATTSQNGEGSGDTNDPGTTDPNGGQTTATNPYVQASDMTQATTNNILNAQHWTPPQFWQTYGNYGAQFPDLNTQIGAAMYSNIQPQQYTPSWAVQNLPARLAGPGYLNGGNMGNYGKAFAKYGKRELGNPFPGNGYNLQSMNVPPAFINDYGTPNYNPFTRNQNGNMPYGAPGGAGNPLQSFMAQLQGLLGASK